MYNSIIKIKRSKNSWVVQWLGLHASTEGAQVQTQVQGLRSCKPHATVTKKRKKKKDPTLKLWLHAVLRIYENCSLSDPTWMENTQLQMVLSFKTSFCLHSEVLLWKQKLLKTGRHFYRLSVNVTSSPKQSFQTLQVRGSWKSSLLTWNPSDTSLSPFIFFKSCLAHQKHRTIKRTWGGG